MFALKPESYVSFVPAGVCIMCYVLPVIVHFKLLRHRQVQTQKWQRLKEQQVQVGATLLLAYTLPLLLCAVSLCNQWLQSVCLLIHFFCL